MFDIKDLRTTIVPKSDQLNAEQMLTGDMTVTVTDVRIGSDDQPVVINYQGDEGRPYKPCKTMRKVLIFAWGEDGRGWVGKSMTLYCDHNVKFGGMNVGGIRISHLSDIQRDIAISLTATKGKKAPHTIKVLKAAKPAPAKKTAADDALRALANRLEMMAGDGLANEAAAEAAELPRDTWESAAAMLLDESYNAIVAAWPAQQKEQA